MLNKTPTSWLYVKRIVRFGETDAAGVVHFHHLLRWAHEAWEESLELYGLDASNVFPGCKNNRVDPEISLPIVHCQASFRIPIKTGDHLKIKLAPEKLDLGSFQVKTIFERDDAECAQCLIRHLSIDTKTRHRSSLPEDIDLWLEASMINNGPSAV